MSKRLRDVMTSRWVRRRRTHERGLWRDRLWRRKRIRLVHLLLGRRRLLLLLLLEHLLEGVVLKKEVLLRELVLLKELHLFLLIDLSMFVGYY